METLNYSLLQPMASEAGAHGHIHTMLHHGDKDGRHSYAAAAATATTATPTPCGGPEVNLDDIGGLGVHTHQARHLRGDIWDRTGRPPRTLQSSVVRPKHKLAKPNKTRCSEVSDQNMCWPSQTKHDAPRFPTKT